MTSVSNTQTSALFQTQRPPPPRGNPVAQAIAGEASTGSISATDATALSSALDSIDASLKSGRSDTTGGTSTRLDPSQIQDKISSLIDDQVSSGSLTSDQAETLKSLFQANAPGKGEAGGAGGPGGAPPGMPPSDDSTSTSSTDSSTSVSDLLDGFMKSLQASQTSASGYAASGTTASSASASALLFDFDT
ncbi:hypothetical protein [Methylobacterium sp. E-045]|uniref:hypothetical protein n=1 Tax=Methylobacterium sp. E-045 TaxID=2836575 RepID=UPI001FB938ED|nr:hypothetical protein [Methylobacterium sp. E-045]MCJ2131348.1 hypothetical protein [Methylobacterium sp. E-045]